MSVIKEIPADVPKWRGTITLPDYLTYPNLIKWEKAISEAQKLPEGESVVPFYGILLPVAIGIVEKFSIEGLPEPITFDNFPASPRLVAWLVDEVSSLYKETNSLDPNS